MIELGADINEQDSNRTTGLEWAVIRDRYDAVKTFLELGADPNLDCPMFSVANSQRLTDRIGMAKLLLEHGADINQPFLVEDLPPRNVLSEAIACGHDELVEFLKARGAKLPEKPRGSKPEEPPRWWAFWRHRLAK
ncbi:MAG TPA: ankyrin repeat domain-containing protein [Pirellulales bacterium]|nr:ankyrin repeat domain-containing protein [Pirellulales bacterium]